MKKILIIKMSSMGDVIHTLPAISDAKHAFPQLSFDWVIEESFQEIPNWHPAVDKVIPVALRRWRKNLYKKHVFHQWVDFRRQLRAADYDLVIDVQGLAKSAFIATQARGIRVGLDRDSAREPLASVVYQQKYPVNKTQHAIQRTRQLLAQALNYQFNPDAVNYGIDSSRLGQTTGSTGHIVFLHGTSWATKHWPEQYWCELAQLISQQHLKIVIPWGSADEYERAKRIAQCGDDIEVLPRLSLGELAGYFINAAGIVAVDTGLGHLAAALNVPTLTLYGPTDAKLTGTKGLSQRHLCADFACAPCLRASCRYQEKSAVFPACFSQVTPESVWHHLQKNL